jgi:SagB-type dehydrogenase family enzyme
MKNPVVPFDGPPAAVLAWTAALRTRALATALLLGLAGFAVGAAPAPGVATAPTSALPAPRAQGPVSLEAALAQRRSQRSFGTAPLTSAEAGQLLWAAQGITDGQGERNAPSAGATYPLVLYLVAGRVDGLAAGVYRYLPQGHGLQAVAVGDVRAALASATRGQGWVADAPALVVIAAQPARTVARYGARADGHVAMEAGAAAQNLLLQAVALGLGGTLVGAFDETTLRRSLALAEAEQPLAIVPVGRSPRGRASAPCPAATAATSAHQQPC